MDAWIHIGAGAGTGAGPGTAAGPGTGAGTSAGASTDAGAGTGTGALGPGAKGPNFLLVDETKGPLFFWLARGPTFFWWGQTKGPTVLWWCQTFLTPTENKIPANYFVGVPLATGSMEQIPGIFLWRA